MPIPVVELRVQLLAGIGCPVEHEPIAYPWYEILPGFCFDLPGGVGVDYRFSRALSLHQKRGALADDRERGVDTEVKDGRGNHVIARVERGRQIECFIAPMGQVSLGRAFSDPQPVYIKDEVIVGADLNWEVRRLRVQVDDPAEMKDTSLARWGCRMGNPLRRPMLARHRQRGGGLWKCQWTAQQEKKSRHASTQKTGA